LDLEREMKYTKSDIKKLGICPDYTDERLDELAAGRESLSERELSELDIPIDDRLWLLGRLCADDRNTVARRIATDVIPLWKCPVPDVVKRYLETGESNIKAAAGAAADAVSGASTWAIWAAGAATGAATWAAGDAAEAAAGATWDAAMLESKKKYLDWMVEFCESREAGF
jgi:hypothetical protein